MEMSALPLSIVFIRYSLIDIPMPTGEQPTCTYTHQFEHDEWECPHPAPDDEHCIFHQPASETPAAAVRDALIEALAAEPARWEFIGATVPDLNLQHILIDLDNQEAVDFRDITVAGDLQLDYLTVRQPFDLRGAEVSGNLEAFNVDLESEFRAAGLTIHGACRIVESVFSKRANYNKLTVHGDVELTEVRFRRRVSFNSADIGGEFLVEETRFDGRVSLRNIDFGVSAQISPLSFSELYLDAKTPPDNGLISLVDTTIQSGSIILGQDSDHIPLYDCSGTTIGSVQIRHSSGGVFQHLRFDNTEFDGFDFNRYTAELRRNNYNIHTTNREQVQSDGGSQSVDYQGQSVVYANAADGARKIGASLIASNFKIRHRALKRHAYLNRIVDSNSPFEVSSSVLQYLSSSIEALLTGYGERPNRVIFSAINVIFPFAIFYWQFGSASRTETFLSAFTLSVETMLAFLIGLPDLTETSALIELLLNLQAALGFFLLGVVFVSIIDDQLT